MNAGNFLKDRFLRIDARSLGLFRLAMGGVLLADLFRRWRYLKAFYSNDGVLPNHNHIFNLKEGAQVWSALHAFSAVSEGVFAFCLITFFYLCFLIGWKTRAFQVLALVSLVSLGSRDILLENAGNYAAVAMLAFTLFLPLGSRFSLDALIEAMGARDEKRASELNDRPLPSQEAVLARRGRGWSPASIAGFAATAQIAIIYLTTAIQQRGAWRDGTALWYAINTTRWVSRIGASARSLPPGVLSAWTSLLYAAEWAIPVLIFVPVARRLTRGAAIALSLVYGLTMGMLFDFGLYGWTLLAAAALLVPEETWARIEGQSNAKRATTLIYDADCGVCLFLCRVLARLDLRHELVFQGNDDLDGLNVRRTSGAKGAIERAPLPSEVTPELVSRSVVLVDAAGRVFTRGAAVAAAIRVLPFGFLGATLLRLPGIAQLANLAYDAFAARRERVSVLIGKEACGIHDGPAVDSAEEAPANAGDAITVAPATKTARFLSGSLRELAVGVVFLAALAQTGKANALPFPSLPQGSVLQSVAAWPRMLAKWNVLTPEPPRQDELFVIDAQTKGGQSVDPLTGREPALNPSLIRGTGMGQLWGDYLTRMHDKEWIDFQKAFREHLTRGGLTLEDKKGDDQLVGLDAYWVKEPIPGPGGARNVETITRDRLFSHARGGKLALDKSASQRPASPFSGIAQRPVPPAGSASPPGGGVEPPTVVPRIPLELDKSPH